MDIGVKIKESRRIHNVSMKELAAKINATEAYIINLENGKIQNPPFFTIMKIAKYLHMDVYDLEKMCIDPEWIKLMKEAKDLGLTITEIQSFIKDNSPISIK